jgi:DNA-binding IclR family transcriptional regulator
MGSPIGAISVSGSAARMDPAALEAIRPHLLHATDEISRMMGQVF